MRAGALEHEGSGAGHGRHHRAAQGRDLPDRRQADACGDQGLNRLARKQAEAATILCAARQAGGAMMAGRYTHAKQFKRQQPGVEVPAHAARPADPRHRPQDRRPAGALKRLFAMAAGARHADPLAEPQSARPQALFLACARGRMHRQGQGRTPYEFGVKVSITTTNDQLPPQDHDTTIPIMSRTNR